MQHAASTLTASADNLPANQWPQGEVHATPKSLPTKGSLDGHDIVQEVTDEEPEQRMSGNEWDVDPANPRTWSTWRKWRVVFIVSFYTFTAPLASSMMAPGLPEIAERYDISNPTVVSLTLSVYLLAFCVSPFFVGPLSEMYGRTWVLHFSNLFFVAFCLGSIFAPNTSALIAFRFFAGLGGCTPVAIGGGSISDLFNEKERSTAMSVYTIGPLLAPVLGPIAGGFIVQSIGIKWVFIVLTILAGIGSLIGIPFLEETYTPVIKQRLLLQRARDAEIGEKALAIQIPPKRQLSETFKVNLSRPFVLLTRSLICFMLSLYMALIYGFLYLMFTTFPTLFNDTYGWGPGVSGLAYLGPGVGFCIAQIVVTPLLDFVYSTLSARNGGKGKPEFRIPAMFLGSILVPIGLLWYGWSAQARLHFIMPIIGSAIFAAGMMFAWLPISLYLVDAFTYAASALAAASVFRSLFGFIFPLFGEQMFAAMGSGGGNSLLAGLAIVIGIPFPIWMFYKGEEIRKRNPLNR